MSRRLGRATKRAAVVAALILRPIDAAASECSPTDGQWPGEQHGGRVNLVAPTPYNWITAAVAQWNLTCDVDQIPTLQMSSSPRSGMLNVNVTYHPGTSTSSSHGCGEMNLQYSPSTGQIVSGTIHIWEKEANGTTCNLERITAHELGHLFGLTDAFLTACQGNVMYYASVPQQANVTTNDCESADAQWLTPTEVQSEDDPPLPVDPPEGESPIIVDLDRDQFHLTGLHDGVFFDIDADGEQELLSWTSEETLDAFLWLDRNGNGAVDGGLELFGNHTPLIDGSSAGNGYVALAEFDLIAVGGNENGLIDAGDVVYGELRLWIDWDHNGHAEQGEQLALAEAGVTRISLDYHSSRRRDRHGNYFRYVSRAWISVNGRERAIWTGDVFFIVQE